MTSNLDYKAAVARANLKRAEMLDNVETFRARVSPLRLKADAKTRVRAAVSQAKDNAKSLAGRHPVATSVVTLGIFAWFFRRPIARLFRRGHRSDQELANPQSVTSEQPSTNELEARQPTPKTTADASQSEEGLPPSTYNIAAPENHDEE